MNRARKSQVREILLQLTDLRNRLSAAYRDAGEDMTAHENIVIRKGLTNLDEAIIKLTEVI